MYGTARVAPSVASISPSTIPIGGSGVQVTIAGSGFGTSPTLPSSQQSSDAQITVTLTAGFSATIGYANLSVTSSGETSNTKQILLNGPAYAVVISDVTGQEPDGKVVRLTNYHVYDQNGASEVVFPIAEDFIYTSAWSCTNASQPSRSTTPCDGKTSTTGGVFQDSWSDWGTYYTPANCGTDVTDHWQWCAPTGPNPGKTFMTLTGFIHTNTSEINGYVNPPNQIPGGTVFNP